MALRASMRRDQRRRLLASRNRAADGLSTGPGGADLAVSAASYDDEAHPERHPALATRLPVAGGRFLAAAVGILLVFVGAIALAVSGPLFSRPLWPTEGRFARTLTVLAGAFDPQAALPVQVWLAELALLLAAAVAGSVRFMRRHRRDDFKGRFRAWGWLAVLLTVAAWAGAVPVGAVVAAAVSDVTGIVAGPGGIGWWVGLAGVSLAAVVPWAVLPLRERALPIVWMVLALTAWGLAAAVPWVEGWAAVAGRGGVIAQAAWVAGAGLMLIAMLAAARSVIREVRGQSGPPAVRPKAAPREQSRKPGADNLGAEEPEAERFAEAQPGEEELDGGSWADSDEGDSSAAGGEDDDDSGQSHRRLSKAERKRLRKLARMNGQAA
jgi:hypothetical protein